MNIWTFGMHVHVLGQLPGVKHVDAHTITSPAGALLWEIAVVTDDNPGILFADNDGMVALSRAEAWVYANTRHLQADQ